MLRQSPGRWEIISNDGITISAKNSITGEVFNGPTADFNTLLKSDGIVGNYTASLEDADLVKRFLGSTDANFIIPPDILVPFPVLTAICVVQIGTGKVTFVAGDGVTLRHPSDVIPKTRKQNSTLSVIKLSANEWAVMGDATATEVVP